MHLHAVELAGVCEVTLLLAIGELIVRALLGLDNADDIEAVLVREIKVSLIVRRNCHDNTRTVACNNIIRSPDRNLTSVQGVDGISAGEDAGLLTCRGHTLDLGDLSCCLLIFFDCFSAIVSRKLLTEL